MCMVVPCRTVTRWNRFYIIGVNEIYGLYIHRDMSNSHYFIFSVRFSYLSVQYSFTVNGRSNLAYGRYTRQSSTRGEFSSDKAVDGSMEQESCSITTGKEAPWWRVVLDGEYDIHMVAIKACHSCELRLTTFLPFVSSKLCKIRSATSDVSCNCKMTQRNSSGLCAK